MTKYARERLGAVLQQDDYIAKLLEIFSQCEDLEDDEGIGHLFQIFRGPWEMLCGCVGDVHWKLMRSPTCTRDAHLE